MVLADLGSKITKALSAMTEKVVIDRAALDELVKELCRALFEADVNVKLVMTLRQNIMKNINLDDLAAGVNKRKMIQKTVCQELINLLDCKTQPYKPVRKQPNVFMFVGLQGAGKTTTVTKIANYYQRKGWKAALVCADTFRAGAFDQLRQNAIKAKIPFYGSYTEQDPVKVAADGVKRFREENYEIIIVDTSGRHSQETELFKEMKQIEEAVDPDDIIFVMDSSIGQAAHDQAQAFKAMVAVGSVVVTKMDGHAKGGGALSAVAATQAPVVFTGTGEHIDDIEPFNARSFVSRLLGMGDIGSLVENIQQHVDLEKQPEMLARLTEGKFTLRDMREQFQTILNMGPISKVMSMLPGFMEDMIPKGKEAEGSAQIKRFMCIMDSMNAKELDNEVQVTGGRIARIARGSGCSNAEVQALLEKFKQFVKFMSKVKLPKGMTGKGGAGGDPAAMMRNMNMSASQMSRMFNPAMLKQMGGVSGLQGMMKQMAKGMGGMGGMGGDD